MNDSREKEHFYDDLDKTKAHKSCCTCGGLIFFFISLLLVSSAAVFYLYWQLGHVKFLPIKLPSSKMLAGFVEKVNLATKNEDSETTISLNDSELSALLNDGISFDNFIFKNIQAEIRSEDILISGLLKPLSAQIEMKVSPAVVDEKVVFAVKEIKSQNIKVPAFLNGKFEENLNGFLNAKLTLVYSKIAVQEITLKEGELLLKGRSK